VDLSGLESFPAARAPGTYFFHQSRRLVEEIIPHVSKPPGNREDFRLAQPFPSR
jgi:hypothetical protein